jgi:hypothetical protein
LSLLPTGEIDNGKRRRIRDRPASASDKLVVGERAVELGNEAAEARARSMCGDAHWARHANRRSSCFLLSGSYRTGA